MCILRSTQIYVVYPCFGEFSPTRSRHRALNRPQTEAPLIRIQSRNEIPTRRSNPVDILKKIIEIDGTSHGHARLPGKLRARGNRDGEGTEMAL